MTAFSVKIDGTDLATHGLSVDRDASGWRDAPEQNFPLRQLPTRVGQALMSKDPNVPGRRLTISGRQKGSSQSDLQKNEDDLKALVLDGRVQVEFGAQTGRLFKAWADGQPRFRPVGPQFAAPWIQDVRIEMLAPDPLMYSTTLFKVDFGSAVVGMPQGTAFTAPKIEIEGPVTDPTIEYRNGDGKLVQKLSLSASIPSGNVWTIENDLMTITNDAGGNELPSLVSGTDFITMSGRDVTDAGDPTLEISPDPARATCIYRKAWF